MASSSQQLNFAVRAVNEASKTLKDIQGDIEDMGKKADSSSGHFGGLGDAIGKVGTVAAGFLAANVIGKGIETITSTVTDSIAGWKEHLTVLAQTEAVLKSTGGAAGLTSKDLEDMANSLKNTSLFEDDAIQSGENLLLTFTGIGKDVFPDATQAMLDMSQALGQDMKSSAVQLGKALNDPIKGVSALSKVGVSFTEEQKEQIKAMTEAGDVAGAQKLILAELNKEFGGSAKAASDAAGASATMADKMDDLNDTIGEKLLPIQEKFKEAQIAVISFMVEKALPTIEKLGQWLGEKLAPALDKVGGFINDTVVPALRDKLIPAFLDFSEKAEPVVKAVLGAFENFATGDVLPKVETAIGLVRDAIEKAGPPTAELAKQIGEKLWPPLKELIDFVSEHKEVLAALGIAIVTVLTPAIIGWTIATIAQTVATAALAVATVIAYAPIIAITAAIALVVLGIIEAVKHWDEIKAAIERFVDRIQDWIGSHQALAAGIALLLGPISLVIAAGVLLIEHWDEVKAKAVELKDGIVEQITALKDGAVGLWESFRSKVGEIAGGIKDDVVGAFRSMVSTVVGLVNAMISGINGAISAINSALAFSITFPTFDTHIPGVGTVGGGTFAFDPKDIPQIPLVGGVGNGGTNFDPGILGLATGTDYVPKDMLALLHKGEAVVPASMNRGGADGGGDIHLHIHVAQPLATASQLANAIAPALVHLQRRGWHGLGAT